jgi:prepilin-type N-terminal cleavage/methylation domain-containing protein
MKRQSGVTLLEMLIAVTLFGIIMAGAFTALRAALSGMKRTNERFLASRRVLGAQKLLERQMAGFMPVVARCIAAGGSGPGGELPFFQGETETMRFVSSYSLGEGARGAPRILEFQVIPRDSGPGVRLVVNEHLYTGPFAAGRFCFGMAMDPVLGQPAPRFTPVEVGPGSFVLADRLASCRFLFKEPLPPPLFERWLGRWIHEAWPKAIRIEMIPLENDPGKPGPVTLTIPVFVTRVPQGVYFD